MTLTPQRFTHAISLASVNVMGQKVKQNEPFLCLALQGQTISQNHLTQG